MSIKIYGLDRVLDAIENVEDTETIEKSLQKACALVERSAKEKAPKDNGELRRSIASKVEDLKGIVFTPLFYAPYVEYGTGLFAEGTPGGRTDVPWSYQDDKGEWHSTSGQKPQPFMKPALNENTDEIVKIIREGLLND